MVSKGVMVGGVILLLVIGLYVVSPQSFNFNLGGNNGGGVQAPPIGQPPKATDSGFTGQLTINLVHRDALDNAETRTEATNLATTFYKPNSDGSYQTIGSGTGNTVTITDDMQSTMLIGVQLVSGQSYFVAPSSTANANNRITDFDFYDVTNDGTKEWVFTYNLKNMPVPVAGQTASTVDIYINSYDDGSTTLNSPSNSSAVSATAGTKTWLRWEQTVGVETADPVYEYEIKFNSTDTSLWDRGQSILSIPNMGDRSMTDFVESQDGTSTFYKLNLGSTLKGANFVATAQNGNTVHPIPFKLQHNLAASGSSGDGLVVTLTIRSMTAAQGTTSTNDAISVCTCPI